MGVITPELSQELGKRIQPIGIFWRSQILAWIDFAQSDAVDKTFSSMSDLPAEIKQIFEHPEEHL